MGRASYAVARLVLNPVQEGDNDQQHHDGEDDRHVAELGRVGDDERRCATARQPIVMC